MVLPIDGHLIVGNLSLTVSVLKNKVSRQTHIACKKLCTLWVQYKITYYIVTACASFALNLASSYAQNKCSGNFDA